MANIICDFCCSRTDKVTWRYPCNSFVTYVETSYGDWAACDVCHEFIESNFRHKLLERSFQKFCENIGEPVMPAAITKVIGNLHDLFFANRCGSCYSVADNEPNITP